MNSHSTLTLLCTLIPQSRLFKFCLRNKLLYTDECLIKIIWNHLMRKYLNFVPKCNYNGKLTNLRIFNTFSICFVGEYLDTCRA